VLGVEGVPGPRVRAVLGVEGFPGPRLSSLKLKQHGKIKRGEWRADRLIDT